MRIDGERIASGGWRRGRDVLDAYDTDRVVSEALADDLVNDLVGLRGGRRTCRPTARRMRSEPVRRGHLRLVAGRPDPG